MSNILNLNIINTNNTINNCLLDKYEYIINKYKIKKKNLNNDVKILFLELCKIKNINQKYIINFIREYKNINYDYYDINKKNSFCYIFENFINSDIKYTFNYINIIKEFVIYIDKSDIKLLINEINKKINKYSSEQNIYLSLKSLNIFCNKYLFKNNVIKRIDNILNAIKNTDNIKRIIFYVKKILYYIEQNNNLKIDYLEIINILENILYNNDIVKDNNTEYMLLLLNKCKKINEITYNELENILLKIDRNIYDYIYFLRNSTILNNRDNIIYFLEKLNYFKKDIKDIDKLNLKRGFIQGLKKNNKTYLLKYQPNKSFVELIFNTYIKLFSSKNIIEDSPLFLEKNINFANFLIPIMFIVNSDNSYFYIIEKYHTDLNKYFNILYENNKILSFDKIIEIVLFLIKSILILHKNNIIHCDLKLENIVVNIDENNDIKELKIIDFDVSVFNNIPKELDNISEKYKKILNNKKQRGTRIYMLKNESMEFNNDIYSLGIVLLILLYKNIKLLISQKKKILENSLKKDKKQIIKYQNILKKLNNLKENIEDNNKKIEILDLLEFFLKRYKNDSIDFLGINSNKFNYFKELIIDCINIKLNINELYDKYSKTLFI
jgi:serine/threonine protein kinase